MLKFIKSLFGFGKKKQSVSVTYTSDEIVATYINRLYEVEFKPEFAEVISDMSVDPRLDDEHIRTIGSSYAHYMAPTVTRTRVLELCHGVNQARNRSTQNYLQ